MLFCTVEYNALENMANSNRVFLLQKRVIRIMPGAGFRDHCRPHFKILGILTQTSIVNSQ